MTVSALPTLRHHALAILALTDPLEKGAALQRLAEHEAQWPVGAELALADPGGLPGRPAHPELVAPAALGRRSPHTVAGRVALLHSLAHIEFNAINLALDIVWRFAGLPDTFYRDWMGVAYEEGLHFRLLAEHLANHNATYGDMPAHDGLWDMALRTRDDLLARIALVPRTLEARGLDASPLIRDKLAAAGDARGAEILDIILRDEIGHVSLGNQWFAWVCAQQGKDPLAVYPALAEQYRAPKLRGPFNLPARREAGFTESELRALLADQNVRAPDA